MQDNLNIGYVVEIKGKHILVKVYENKNGLIILNNGDIIKNVSVGSFVSIGKGFINIIAKIDGEYIKRHEFSKNEKFYNESQETDRIIELSVMGIIENNVFKRGILELPLLMAEVSILNKEQIETIFKFSRENESISIGSMIEYKDFALHLDTNSLFASHIGIFGNTGSGKSNTLAKLYNTCLNNYGSYNGFNKSKFILIDFNGEYEQSIINNHKIKKYYNVSTHNDNGHKIPISSEILNDIDFWSIICEATEKTQKPFLSRTLKKFSYKVDVFYESLLFGKKKLEEEISRDLKLLFRQYYSTPRLLVAHHYLIYDLIKLAFGQNNDISEILRNFEWHRQQDCIKTKQGEYASNEDSFEEYVVNPIVSLIDEDDIKIKSEYDIFEYTMLYSYLSELSRQYINEEHIAPMIKRFNNRVNQVRKVFDISGDQNMSQFTIFSLLDVNIQFKKMIPLVLCKYYYDSHKHQYAKNSTSSLHIIIDEAHNILSKSSERESKTWKDYRLETFEEIIKEGRKFGVFLTIASQRPSDISDTIISQLHNYFIHRLVNNEDLKSIGKAVSFIDKASFDMISVLPQGGCIFSGVSSNFPILMQVALLEEEVQPKSSTINLTKLWTT